MCYVAYSVISVVDKALYFLKLLTIAVAKCLKKPTHASFARNFRESKWDDNLAVLASLGLEKLWLESKKYQEIKSVSEVPHLRECKLWFSAESNWRQLTSCNFKQHVNNKISVQWRLVTWDGSVELCMGTALAVSASANTTSTQNTPAIAVPLAVSSSDIPTEFLLGDLDAFWQFIEVGMMIHEETQDVRKKAWVAMVQKA